MFLFWTLSPHKSDSQRVPCCVSAGGAISPCTWCHSAYTVWDLGTACKLAPDSYSYIKCRSSGFWKWLALSVIFHSNLSKKNCFCNLTKILLFLDPKLILDYAPVLHDPFGACHVHRQEHFEPFNFHCICGLISNFLRFWSQFHFSKTKFFNMDASNNGHFCRFNRGRLMHFSHKNGIKSSVLFEGALGLRDFESLLKTPD